MKRVKVQFLFDGEIRENESVNGMLIGDKVLVYVDHSFGLYDADMKSEGVYVVNMDSETCEDHLAGAQDFIYEAINCY